MLSSIGQADTLISLVVDWTDIWLAFTSLLYAEILVIYWYNMTRGNKLKTFRKVSMRSYSKNEHQRRPSLPGTGLQASRKVHFFSVL